MAVGGRSVSLNGSKSCNRSVEKVFDEAQITSELKLCNRKLKEFPKSALKYNLSDTVFADLSKNRFGEIPADVCNFLSLEKLHLHQNVIKSIPDSVTSLQCLSHLILSRNQLSTLPECVCRLSSLQVLDVSGNRLVSLPEELGQLTQLTELDTSYNQLQFLPPSLGDLDRLRWLKLRRNLLQNIPIELCFLRLTWLDLSSNQISSLPLEMRFMSSLIKLLLDANPLVQPPAKVCMRGRVHIFKWLDQSANKHDKKREALSEVEFRRLRKIKNSPVADFRLTNGLEINQKRGTVDSGYSTSENGDRWSRGSQEFPDTARLLNTKLDVSRQMCSPQPLNSTLTNGIIMNDSNISGLSAVSTISSRSTSLSDRVNVNKLSDLSDRTNMKLSDQSNMNLLNRSDINLSDRSGMNSSVSSDHTLSGHSTPSTLSPGDSFNLEDEFQKAMKCRSKSQVNGQPNSPNAKNSPTAMYVDAHSSWLTRDDLALEKNMSMTKSPHFVSQSSSENVTKHLISPTHKPYPKNPDPGGSKIAQPVKSPSIPTYREYLENKRHQRALDANKVYKKNGQVSEIQACNGVSKFLENDVETKTSSELSKTEVKNLQKNAVLSYVKSRASSKFGSNSTSPNSSFDSTDSSPPVPPPPICMTALPSSGVLPPTILSGTHSNSNITHPNPRVKGIQSKIPPANFYSGAVGIPSPVPSGANLSIGVLKSKIRGTGSPFEIQNSRLNFTYKREIEKQQHEKRLLDNLRNIIESRLKMTLPADICSALTDGVVLCHLVNHVRPRAVASIHVPSPAAPKLTVAKCRLNVENFLAACRKIGVEEEYICLPQDLLEKKGGLVRVAITVERLLKFYQGRQTPTQKSPNHTQVSLQKNLTNTRTNAQKTLSSAQKNSGSTVKNVTPAQKNQKSLHNTSV